MPPEQRRAAIIEATRPLLLQHGTAFTTRQVAEAAGVAEGTIFRVFENKSDLLWAVIDAAMDPSRTCAAIAALSDAPNLDTPDPEDAGLSSLIAGMIEILQSSIHETSRLFAALHTRLPAESSDNHQRSGHAPQTPESARQRANQLVDAVAARLTPYADQLRLPPEHAASLVRSVAFATSHPFLSDGRISDAHLIAELLLHGLATPRQPIASNSVIFVPSHDTGHLESSSASFAHPSRN